MKNSRPRRDGKRASAPASAAKPVSSLRIIGGQWRGRKLPFVAAEGLRPTGDRIRETLFNWLMADLPNAHCLDAFSGSGALGLEALSRGAASATLIELNADAAAQIRQNLHLLQCDRGQVMQTDCLSYLQQAPPQPFDVVFIDPPFQLDLWPATIAALEQPGRLSPTATIYLETPRQYALCCPPHWHLHRQKQAGDVCYRLYYRDADSHDTDSRGTDSRGTESG